jgi:spectinomycin phosphotransferase
MLEKPAIQDELIAAALAQDYRLNVTAIHFLPLGADQHTAVYRAVTAANQAHFVKLRSGDFNPASVIVPSLLQADGIERVIAPVRTHDHRLWVDLEGFRLAVYPFVEGQNAYEVSLQAQHWVDLGRTLREIHDVVLPAAVRIPGENFSDQWRSRVRSVQQQCVETVFDDPVSAEFAALINARRSEIDQVAARAEALSKAIQQESLEFVLCHGDIHAGNMLIDRQGALHVIDWDTLIYAPRERDLMYAGAGLGGGWFSPDEEERLFYQGYGAVEVNTATLAYYRFERIVQDIAEYSEQILLGPAESADRREGLRQLSGQFLPGQVIAIALQSDPS